MEVTGIYETASSKLPFSSICSILFVGSLLRHIRAIKYLPPQPELEMRIHYVQWAQKARGCYINYLRAAFSTKISAIAPMDWYRFQIGTV